MARYVCPSCGAAYNGRRCKACLYEHFTEEIAHGNHVHKGEPLVVKTPVRRPVQRKDPFDCDKTTRKRRRLSPALVIALLAVLNPLLSLAFNLVEEVSSSISSVTVRAEPEPTPFIPEDALFLGGSEDMEITVLADWQEGQNFGEGFDIYVQNDSDEDIAVAAQEIVVNGCLMENTFFYCNVSEGEGSVGRSTFTLHEDDLRYAGIRDVQTISFKLYAYSLETFDTFWECDPITLTASVPQDAVLYKEQEGRELYAGDHGTQVLFLGFAPHRHDPEKVWLGEFLFYIENGTEETMEVFPANVTINGEETDLSFWTLLPPNTRTVTSMYLYALEDTDIQTPEELEELSFALEMGWGNGYEGGTHQEHVTIPLT